METKTRSTTGAGAAASLEAHLGYWLRLVSNEVSGAFQRALEERHHISVAEWVALNQLATGADLTPARLATAMGMTRGAVSKVLDKLESKKLIVRTTSSADSRVQELSLTAHARRTLPSLTEIANGNDEHFFAVLSPEESSTLSELLRKLATAHHIARIPVA
jgi:DNA-binding MarR family transcriptional regulator